MIDFVRGQIYRRSELHDRYGGQRYGGIATPTGHPFVILVTGAAGALFGYEDRFLPDGTYHYTGEGQVGPMRMIKGNRAILEHRENGKALCLFEDLDDGTLRYLGEAAYLGHHEETRPDRNDAPRPAIVFELEVDPTDASGVGPAAGPHAAPDSPSAPPAVPVRERQLWSRSRDELRAIAAATTAVDAPPTVRRAVVYARSAAVRIYVLKRASGTCEGCGAPAPFTTRHGRPFLETHHVQRRSDGGPDHPRFVAAVCPNCHRRAHHSVDQQQFNADLAAVVLDRET